MSKRHAHLSACLALLVWSGPSISQPVVPDPLLSLSESELAEQCFYQMQITGKLTFGIWEVTGSDKYLSRLSQLAMAAEIWRGRATTGVSGQNFAQAMQRAGEKKTEEQYSLVFDYCFGMARRYVSLLTPAQQKALQSRAHNRVQHYKEKVLRIE